MNGTVIQRKGSATWSVVIDRGKGPDGRRIREWHSGYPTKKTANAARVTILNQLATGTYVRPDKQTLGGFLTEEWLPAIRPALQPSTWESYDRYCRLHVVPRLGQVALQELDAGHLNRFYAVLLSEGRLDTKSGGLSARTVRYIHTIVHRALKDAVAWNRLVRNPADAGRPPRPSDARPPEMVTWPAETLERFLRQMDGDRYSAPFLMLATTGMRRGELLGLRWSDVEVPEVGSAVARIRQTVTAVAHEIVTAHRTKTGRGRAVELDAATAAALRSWRARQAEERLMIGAAYQDNGLVFSLPDGRPYHPERFSREFDRRVQRFGIEPRIRLHDLRHTWATLALQAGVDVKIVADRLGHTTTAITQNIYQHVLPGMQSNAAEKVARLIFTS